MRLTNERTDANVLRTTNTLTQRTFGPKCSGYVALDVSGMKDGDYAGLLALQNKYGFAGVKMSGTSKSIVMVNGTGFSGTTADAASVPLNQNTVYLRIDFDFTNRTDKAYFFYSLNGTNWTAFGTTLQMNYDLEHFTGYRFGLFSYATKAAGGYADFDFFRVGNTITDAINSKVITGADNSLDAEKEAELVQFSPNPFRDAIQIYCREQTDYQIFDLMGKEMEAGTLTSDGSVGHSLPSGCYLLKLNSGNRTKTAKIIKQ